ncbi:LysM peptidoglycan-binding domain-containing protein [Paenibacillus daejeonensis]|uniref:LysM peptidoglycan-binding domain-containing protein n=1 Tax=Paenibacillus daejeonensis TaxID=135193 RepID=UPI000377168A|nr:LysM peptidoglycan-binding domain-containing protein [Paenibacillus daejeonensis]
MKIHIVKQGDTLYQLAGKYGVTVEELLKLNPNISHPDELQVGMKIKVPSSASKPTDMEIAHQHVVKQGDTLWKLSKAWGVPLGDMIKANPQLKNPNVLLTGEMVNIPKTANGKETDLHFPEMPMMPELPTMPIMESPPGKTSTAPIAELPGKTSTAPVMPAPQPEPMPQPMPAEPPKVVQEHHMYPIHLEYHKSTNLFQQTPQPAVEAGAQEPPKTYEPAPTMSYGGYAPAVGGTSQWPGIPDLQGAAANYGHHGYSYAGPQHQVLPDMSGNYGGYGGQPGAYTPYEMPLESTTVGSEMSTGYDYTPQQSWESPVSSAPIGNAGAGMGAMPYGFPGGMPPAWGQPMGPWSGGMYGYGAGPGAYGHPGMMGGPAELMGYQQPMTNYYSPQAYGHPQTLGVADQGYGGYSQVGGEQGAAKKPCNCGCSDKREEDDAQEQESRVVTSTAVPKRAASSSKKNRTKKPVERASTKRSNRRNGQSLPWINN